MFTGTVGSSGGLTGAPATGLTASTASYVIGVATESGALNDWIYVTSFGLVRNINTTGGAEAWVDGEILYYNPAVTGGLTKTLPSAPNPKVQVCAVVHAASNGSLFIRPTFGGVLGQYEGDVQVTSPANGQLLVRDQTAGKWVNAALTAGTAISVTNTAGAVSIANTGVTSLTAGTAISVSGSTGGVTVTNTAPDQTVAITGAGGAVVTGTYPNFTVTTPSGTVTSVTGTSPVVSSGGATPAISLAANYGDTQNPYASKTANNFLAAPNGSTGAPTFRAIVAADIPTLNQNTTGTASNVTGTVAIANGGTGETTRQAAIDALAGAVTSGQYLRGNGTDVVMSAIQAADVPTLNQNTTGTASNVTGTVAIANGGTGQTTATAAFNALNPMTTTGDIIYEASATTAARLPIGSTGQVLTVASGLPAWAAAPSGGQYFGSAAVKAIAYNANSIAENVTVTTGNNGLSAGPITISTGFTVTVQTGAVWVIV
jgi:hypothetical protein